MRKSIAQIWSEEPDHISKNIFNELELYATDQGFYPVQNALFKYMAEEQWNDATKRLEPARYPDLTIGAFNHWYDRLIAEGYIILDKTRSVRMAHLVIVEKSDLE